MGETFQIGDIVTGIYKTGTYVAEITEVRPQQYLLKILAVLKHPMQGDLHHVKQVDVPFFHERRALAFQEQAYMPKQMVKPYKDSIPDYKKSLQAALEKQIAELERDNTPWAQQCLLNLYNLKKDYKL